MESITGITTYFDAFVQFGFTGLFIFAFLWQARATARDRAERDSKNEKTIEKIVDSFTLSFNRNSDALKESNVIIGKINETLAGVKEVLRVSNSKK